MYCTSAAISCFVLNNQTQIVLLLLPQRVPIISSSGFVPVPLKRGFFQEPARLSVCVVTQRVAGRFQD